MNAAQVRHRLLKATGLTYRQWALSRGDNPRTVTQTITRWAGKPDLPRGRKSFRILRDLSQTIGTEITRGVLTEGV